MKLDHLPFPLALLLIPRVLGMGTTNPTPTQADCQSSKGNFTWMYWPDQYSPCQIYGLIAAQCDEQPLTKLTNGTYPVLTNSTANKCSCNLVSYNLLSACSVCQGFGYDDYRVYGKACAAHNIDRTLQVNITAGILPNWAERSPNGTDLWDRELSYSMAVASGATPSTAPAPSAAPTSKPQNHWLTPVICVGTLLFMVVVVAVSSYNTRMRAKGKPGLTLFALKDHVT